MGHSITGTSPKLELNKGVVYGQEHAEAEELSRVFPNWSACVEQVVCFVAPNALNHSEVQLHRTGTSDPETRFSPRGGGMRKRWPDKFRRLCTDIVEATKIAKLIAIEIVLFVSFVHLLIKSLIARLR
jgi:hypothetical protein